MPPQEIQKLKTLVATVSFFSIIPLSLGMHLAAGLSGRDGLSQYFFWSFIVALLFYIAYMKQKKNLFFWVVVFVLILDFTLALTN